LPNREYNYAEIQVDKLLLESFANEKSAYFSTTFTNEAAKSLEKYRSKLKWHIKRSLSRRQQEVIQHYLTGKTEREIAKILGITQQVVNIYKHRAIKKLHKHIAV
jgi:DNA-binding NarL/FixJ family response regulator